jgi:alanyl-tRNA synthetase
MTPEQIAQVEEIVNHEILANAPTDARVMAFDDAVKAGAVALFGEKYGDSVRVLDIGSSRELCGGTHVQRTGDIGLFKIVSESGVAAGVRRVEAITGDNVLHWAQSLNATASEIAAIVKSTVNDAANRVAQLQEQLKATERELVQARAKASAGAGAALVDSAVEVAGLKVLAHDVVGADPKGLRDMVDQLKDKLQSGVVVLATATDGKVSLVAGVTKDLIGQVKAGDLASHVASQVGGKGGGRPDMAMGGGTEAGQLAAALKSVPAWIETNLKR